MAVGIVSSLKTKSRLHQELCLVAGFLGSLCQGVAFLRGITQLEFLDDVVADATAAEILFSDGDAVGVVFQRVVKPVLSPLVDDEHRLALTLCSTLLVGQLFLNNLDVVFPSQPAQGLWIGHLLVLHEEAGRRATLAADETVADILRRRHHERWVAVVVEGAQALVVHAALTE